MPAICFRSFCGCSACGMTTLLYLTGIADDLVGVRYRQKFAIQIFCACLSPCRTFWILNDLYGLVRHTRAFRLMSAYLFTVLMLRSSSPNAINLIDGIDGLASGLEQCGIAGFHLPRIISKGLWSYAMLFRPVLSAWHAVLLLQRVRQCGALPARFFHKGRYGKPYSWLYPQLRTAKVQPAQHGYHALHRRRLSHRFQHHDYSGVRWCVSSWSASARDTALSRPDKNHIHHKLLAIGLSPRRAMLSLLSMSCAFRCGQYPVGSFI